MAVGEYDDAMEEEVEEEEEDEGPEVVSIDEEDQAELLADWAADAIQAAWRKLQLRRGTCASGVKRSPRSSTRQAHESGGEICCVCFAPLTPGDAKPRDSKAAAAQLFCSNCQHQLERGSRSVDTNGTPTTVAAPLPKLSLLVQTEAKYQDQLRLLRQQQELLKQQQQEIETRKKIQAETQQLAKQLARQRRRHFQELMARRQAEEAQKIQEMPRPASEEPQQRRRQQPVNPGREGSKPPCDPAIVSTTTVDPAQLRRHRIPARSQSSKRDLLTQDAASKAAELAEKAAIQYRRKQNMETMKCYAQDLTPLIHGQKPKKLPLPAQPPQGSTGAKKPTQKPAKPSKITLVPLQQPPQKGKKIVTNNNQTELPRRRVDDDDLDDELRVLIPRRTNTHAMPTPLTAEIKPVSWMYELLSSDPVLRDNSHGKQSNVHNHSASASASASILGTSLSSMTQSRTQLTALLEEDDEPINTDCVQQRHSLSSSSFNGNAGQRVTLAPLACDTTATTTAAPAPIKREYTSERLASLLEKYHVSVSTGSTSR